MKKYLLLVFTTVLICACSTENEGFQNEDQQFVEMTLTTAKNMTPNAVFDNSEKGIYHGIIAAAYGQSRGKVWISVGNDDTYSAYVELVNGSKFKFELEPSLTDHANEVFSFKSDSGSFVLDVSNFEAPIAKDIILEDSQYFMRLFKKTSRGGFGYFLTGTFIDPGFPSFIGTWNIITPGFFDSPNGFGGDEIAEVYVTYNGNEYSDFEFEGFPSDACLGLSEVIPAVVPFGGDDFDIWADEQVSFLTRGTVEWSLSVVRFEGFDDYIDLETCGSIPSGFFSWTNNSSTVTRTGELYLDLDIL